MKKEYIMTIIVAVVVGAGAFFGGMQYQKSNTLTPPALNGLNRPDRQNGMMASGAVNRNAAGRPVSGEIIAQDGNSITVKLQDGSSKIINISDTTTYSKTDSVTKSDIQVGQTIAVFGTTNTDGSVTAQNVQLNPMFRIGTNGMMGSASPNPAQK